MAELTVLESRYVAVETAIGDCNDRLQSLHRILGRGDNFDLFTPDNEFSEWVGIRLACLAEADRLEHVWQVAHG